MEEWREIPGFDSYYLISSFGEIYNRKRKRFLKASKNPKGRLCISIRKDGIHYSRRIHQLVALAFLGPIPLGKEVNHKDGDKLNNHFSNLEYLTPEENRIHAYKIGIYPKCIQGENNGQSKLKEKEVLMIRKLHSKENSPKKLAKRFGVFRTTIINVISRETWNHV